MNSFIFDFSNLILKKYHNIKESKSNNQLYQLLLEYIDTFKDHVEKNKNIIKELSILDIDCLYQILDIFKSQGLKKSKKEEYIDDFKDNVAIIKGFRYKTEFHLYINLYSIVSLLLLEFQLNKILLSRITDVVMKSLKWFANYLSTLTTLSRSNIQTFEYLSFLFSSLEISINQFREIIPFLKEILCYSKYQIEISSRISYIIHFYSNKYFNHLDLINQLGELFLEDLIELLYFENLEENVKQYIYFFTQRCLNFSNNNNNNNIKRILLNKSIYKLLTPNIMESTEVSSIIKLSINYGYLNLFNYNLQQIIESQILDNCFTIVHHKEKHPSRDIYVLLHFRTILDYFSICKDDQTIFYFIKMGIIKLLSNNKLNVFSEYPEFTIYNSSVLKGIHKLYEVKNDAIEELIKEENFISNFNKYYVDNIYMNDHLNNDEKTLLSQIKRLIN